MHMQFRSAANMLVTFVSLEYSVDISVSIRGILRTCTTTKSIHARGVCTWVPLKREKSFDVWRPIVGNNRTIFVRPDMLYYKYLRVYQYRYKIQHFCFYFLSQIKQRPVVICQYYKYYTFSRILSKFVVHPFSDLARKTIHENCTYEYTI